MAFDPTSATLAPDHFDASTATPEPAAPASGGFDPTTAETPEAHVQRLISDPKFSPADYAIQTGDKETAFQAREALRNRSLGDKATAAGQALTEPATYGNALVGAGKFAAGLVAAPLHGIAQGAATFAAPIAGAVGADNLQRTLENEQQTQGAESTLAGQRVEEGLRATGRAVKNFAQDHPALATIANPIAGVLPQQPAATEQDQRARFDDEIQAAKNAQQLQQQQPLNTGAVAAAAKLATNQENLQDIYSPNALAIQGARPVSPFLTQSMAAAGDPTNLAIPLAGEIPGVKTLAGGLVQGAGKAASAVGSGLGYLASAQRTLHVPILTALTHGITGGLEAQAAKLGTQLGSKAFGFVGEALDAQGGAMRTGIPSALDQTAQQALTAGESAIGTNTQRVIGNTTSHIVATSLGFAPVNAVLADGDPRKFAQSEVGAGAMGGIFGLAGERGRMQDIANYRLAQYGAQQFTENPMWQAHQATMSKFSPADQQAINALRGTLYGGTGTDVLVLDGQNFAKQVGAIGGDARGQFAADPSGNTIYLNADAVGGKASGALDTAGHETGHAVVDFLQKAGREADAQNLLQSISSALTPEQSKAMADDYHAKLLSSTDLSGKTPAEIDTIKQQIVSANPPEKITEENLAEITRNILNGRPISSFAIPKTMLEKVSDAASRWMEARGWSPAIDPDASLGFKAQMVREGARQMSDVLYETGKRASENAGAGETDGQRLIKARAELANIPPITPDMPATKAAAIRRQQAAAQKVVDEIQGKATPETPVGTTPEGVVDNTPIPAADTLNRFRIAAILRKQGLTADEAKQWAQSATGATDEEAVVNALRARANQKFPTQPTPQPQPSPIVPAPTEPAKPITPKPDEPGPVSTPKESEPLPTSGSSVPPSTGGGVETAEPLQVSPQTEEKTPLTREDFEQIAAKAKNDFLATKDLATRGKNKGSHTAENQRLSEKAAFDAAAQAHADSQPLNYQGMRQRVDAFGKKTVSGQLDPSRPFDSWLIDQAKKSGMLTDASLQTLLKFQDVIGQTVTYDYGHAPTEEGEQPTKESRAGQQAKNSAAKRISGEAEQQVEPKTSIPLSIGFNSGSKSFTVFGASPEKLLNNYNHISDALQSMGGDAPYKSINDPQLVADIKTVIRNHQNGWQGDGSRPAVGTAEYPNTVNPDWANSPLRTQIPTGRFEFVNMMLGDEGAKQGTPQAKAKAHLANENYRLINEAGETNELRQRINDAIPQADKNGNPSTWSSVNLEDPLNENISSALADNIREPSQSDESIRQHGKVGDLGRFFEGGKTPNRTKTAAGFMPREFEQDENGRMAPRPYSDEEAKTIISNSNLLTQGGAGTDERMGELASEAQDASRWRTLDAGGSPAKQMAIARMRDRETNALTELQSMTAQRERAEKATGIEEEPGLRDYIAKIRAGKFMPDTGAPEEGDTPGERLAREAEQAGVVLKVDQLKGLIQEDKTIMDKIRDRIQQQTGKPARFLPAEPFTPSPSDKNAIDVGEPEWVQRFQSLMHKEDEGDLSEKDSDELDALHQKLDKLYPGGSKAFLKRYEGSFMPSEDVGKLLDSVEKKNSLGERKIKPEDIGLPYEQYQPPEGQDGATKEEIPVSALKLGRDELVKARLMAANRLFQSQPFRDTGVSEIHVVPSREEGKYVVASNGNHRAAILMLTHPNSRIRVSVTR